MKSDAMTAVGEVLPSSDAEEIERSWREPERFAVLFDRYGAQLHRYAARRLGDGEADDIVAETFLVAFRQRAYYDLGRAEALPWLYGIASNLIRRHRRAEVSRYRTFVRTGVLLDAAVGVAERAVERASAQMSGRRPPRRSRNCRPATGTCCCWWRGPTCPMSRSPTPWGCRWERSGPGCTEPGQG